MLLFFIIGIGHDVKSFAVGGGFTVMEGTSMATPVSTWNESGL